jgi:hypothetical protein
MAKTTMLDLLNDVDNSKLDKLDKLDKAVQITQKVHAPVEEAIKRVSIDCPQSIYISANTLRVLRKQTLKDYILALMMADIEKAKAEKIL